MSLEMRNLKIDGRIKRAYMSSFSGVEDEIYYLMLIGSKVLLCDRSSRTIDIDVDRLFDEFVYYKYYSNMSEIYLLNFFMPLMAVSRSFESYSAVAADMSEKICRFYGREKEKYRYLMDVFCFDVIFRSLLSGKSETVEVLEKIKDGLIEMNPYEGNKLENVKFQMDKIKYIENIHKCIDNYEIDESENIYESGIYVLDIFQYAKGYISQKEIADDSGKKSVLNFIESLVSDSEDEVEYEMKNPKFIEAMSEYILKIRYNEIDTRKYSEKSTPRNFLNLNPGDSFVDPIMNRGEILSKELIEEDGIRKYYVQISTKTGVYGFKYNIVAGK